MKKKGISLLTLIITIIVVIILAGVVVFSLMDNNPADKASEAVFKSDLSAFQEELEMYKLNNITKTSGKYDESALDADKVSATYDGTNIEGISNILGIITKMASKEEYTDILAIQKGELIYIGTDETKKEWAETVGIYGKYKDVSIAEEINKTKVKAGTEVVYTLTVSSQYEITSIDLTGKLVLVDITKNKEIANSTEIITIGEIEQVSKKEKKVEITVKTDELENGKYALKILKEIAVDKNNMTNSKDKIVESFEINTIVYEAIKLTPSTTEWTNGKITVTITYPEGMTIKQYKKGTDEEFKNYIGAIEVEENTQVIAMGKDELGNTTEDSYATLNITNIDKVAPENTTVSNLKSTDDKITATLSYSDNTGGSGIDTSKSKYYISTQSSVYATDASIWNSATTITSATESISVTKDDGTYYVHTLSVDKAGNKKVDVLGSIIIKSDKILPNNTTITSLKTEDNRITATLTYKDNDGGSGIDLTKSKYYISTQSTVYDIDSTIWNNASAITSTTQNISITRSNGIYYIHTLAVDNSGNKKTNVSTGVKVVLPIDLSSPIIIGGTQDLDWEMDAYIRNNDIGSYSYAQFTKTEKEISQNKNLITSYSDAANVHGRIARLDVKSPKINLKGYKKMTIKISSGEVSSNCSISDYGRNNEGKEGTISAYISVGGRAVFSKSSIEQNYQNISIYGTYTVDISDIDSGQISISMYGDIPAAGNVWISDFKITSIVLN